MNIIPKNPLLAETVYYTGLIDVWGRGIQNIVKTLKSEGINAPKFEESGCSFRIVFERPKIINELNGTLSGTLSGTLNNVLDVIKKNPGIQANQIAEKLNKPIDTIKKQVKQLTDKNLIIRKGSRKTGGYSEVKK